MARIFTAYAVCPGTGVAHAQATSTGVADVKTITKPAKATAFFVTVLTTNAIITFDGTTPSVTNGLALQKDVSPVFFPVAPVSLLVAAASAASSAVNIFWVE